ncbi:MAG: hypothetical protein II866_10985 [Prevotella sp.]|nr:hypothetical protein [Prevotella sp.]
MAKKHHFVFIFNTKHPIPLPLRWGEEFFAEEGDEVAEQLFLAGRIVLVIADGVTTDGYQLGGS